MSDTQHQATALVGVVARDAPCRRCGYNLRGLSPESLCPECAAPVRLSLREDRLCFADPGWLRMLWLAAIILEAVALLGLGYRIIRSLPLLTTAPAPVWIWLGPIQQALWLAGAWLLVRPDPGAVPAFPRWQVRALVIGGAAFQFAPYVVPGLAHLPNAGLVALNAAFRVSGLVTAMLQFQHAGRLSRRMPDDRFAATSNRMAWAVAIIEGCGLLVWAMWALMALGTLQRNTLWPLLRIGNNAVTMAGLGMLIATALYYNALRRRLRVQLILGRALLAPVGSGAP